MQIWKIGTALVSLFGRFQSAASDGVITLEEALSILISTLNDLGIKLKYTVSASEALATLRKLNVIA